ncbi:MAG TPA: glycosyltransferase, partial [Actinomycetota bacterium]|nr:glycosyltransferase [Actinomycetota bacterium]
TLAERMGHRDVAVDVFTRCAGRGVPQIEPVGPRGRVIQIQAGPCAGVAKPDLSDLVPDFAGSLLDFVDREGSRYDVVHSHYWLSGDAGMAASRAWDLPLVASFHTLGLVKAGVPGEAPEPPARVAAEMATIARADRVLAPTPAEAAHLIERYGAPSERVRVVPPGVDRSVFRPRPAAEAREALGLGGARVLLFVGRLQSLKGPDVAIRTLAEAVRLDPRVGRDLSLVVVGGPSGPGHDPVERLRDLAGSLGVGERVRFLPPRPHPELPELYSAADVVLVPSRSESFGLVALEAQACGVPVVASSVGGLRYVVGHGHGGLLTPPNRPRIMARRALEILRDPELARRLSAGAIDQAGLFPWSATTERLASVYGELVREAQPAA